jgi:hypothetical protein
VVVSVLWGTSHVPIHPSRHPYPGTVCARDRPDPKETRITLTLYSLLLRTEHILSRWLGASVTDIVDLDGRCCGQRGEGSE